MAFETRLFIGFALNKEINLHLKQSSLWSEDKLTGHLRLNLTNWNEQTFIGLFVDFPKTIGDLKQQENSLQLILGDYCSKLKVEKFPIHLFAQLFIS